MLPLLGNIVTVCHVQSTLSAECISNSSILLVFQ